MVSSIDEKDHFTLLHTAFLSDCPPTCIDLCRWFQLQPNDGAAEGRMLPPGRSSGRRTSRRAQNDDFDDDEDDDDLGEEYDDDEEFADEEGEGSGAGGMSSSRCCHPILPPTAAGPSRIVVHGTLFIGN